MKTWKLALIAAAAGLIHGITSSEPPFPGLQRAAVAMTRLPVSSWVERVGNPSQRPLTADATCIASVAQGELDGINKPTNWKSNSGPQSQIPTVQLAENFFSVDVKNANLLDVLEDLANKWGIEIVGKDVLANKVISVKFDSMELEDGVRQLMRTAGVENYALSYRKESGNQYIVSQIVCLPDKATDSDRYQLAEARQEADLPLLSELPPEAQEELQEEIPAELLGQVLKDMPEELLAQLRNS